MLCHTAPSQRTIEQYGTCCIYTQPHNSAPNTRQHFKQQLEREREKKSSNLARSLSLSLFSLSDVAMSVRARFSFFVNLVEIKILFIFDTKTHYACCTVYMSIPNTTRERQSSHTEIFPSVYQATRDMVICYCRSSCCCCFSLSFSRLSATRNTQKDRLYRDVWLLPFSLSFCRFDFPQTRTHTCEWYVSE